MKVKVLGCAGSEAIGHNPPGFLVNDTVMLDAGTITSKLTVEEQSRITDIFISHTHLDHIKSLLFLADNVIGRIQKPVSIRSVPPVINAIRKHLMNDVIWPDFTKIPTPKNPVLAYAPMTSSRPVSVAGLTVKAVPMNHPVPAVGFVVSDGRTSFLYTADTGPNERIWAEAARARNLKGIIVDTSFPNMLDAIADASGHFTPAQLAADLDKAKVPARMPLFVYHIKPAHRKKVIAELRAMGRKNVTVLQEGKTYRF
ncbi:MAG: 3',5'-cyclic-nucleotide phosphodiesterase [Nitrospiraceae bacterium]|nr:3',5'-cyclic-nucleotide phosphodiesterase [Nitrospiraceae bacterium]